jgi:imidazolonepropionase
MSQVLIKGVSSLVTNDSRHDGTPLGLVNDGAILLNDGKIAWVGETSSAPSQQVENVIDLQGHALIPGFVDSHTHLIFAGDRSAEFRARMQGESYAASGIRSTVAATRAASNGQLVLGAQKLVREALLSGTTTIEVKSGYGLNVADENRLLEIAASLTGEVTFLGAHVFPEEFQNDHNGYVELICTEMIAQAASRAKWIDVFCDVGAFDPDQTRKILKAGIVAGLKPRIHANQLEEGEGIAIGVELDCASVDHVTHATDEDLRALSGSNTVATLLPGAEFSTRSKYPDARRFLEAGIDLAIATDCNPGSSYTTNMSLMIALAVREMFMSPEEALWAATMGGAMALRRTDVGHLSIGAQANFSILHSSSYLHLAYRPGVQLIKEVWRNGQCIN